MQLPSRREEPSVTDPTNADLPQETGASAEGEREALAEHGKALIARKRELEREERSLDVRNETLDTREQELAARRAEIREQETKTDEMWQTFAAFWPSEDDRRDDLLRQYNQLGELAGEVIEQRAALTQERQQTVEPLRDVDSRRYDVESSALNLRTKELNDATRRIEAQYKAWYEDALAHMSNDEAWRQIMPDDYEVTAEWREGMMACLRLSLSLINVLQEWERELDELNHSKERFLIAVNRYHLEDDELRQEISEFFTALAEQDRAMGAAYPVNEEVRRRWLRGIERQTKRIPKRAFGLVLGVMFELFCVDLLEAMSFDEVKWQGGVDDGGVDIWAKEVSYSGDVLNVAVQCKFKGLNGRVGPNDVVLFHGKLPTAEQYHRKIIMTFGRFEPAAEEQGAKYGVEFWDGQRLCKEMARHRVGLQLVRQEDGHDLAIDGEWWDDLIEQAQAEHNSRSRA